MSRAYHIFIVCGGTGGHLAPGVALAQEFLRRGHRPTLIISNKQVDARLVEAYPHMRFLPIASAPLLLRPVALARFFFRQFQGIADAINLIRKEEPDIVVAFGGFTSLGMVVAASMRHIPVALHEANRKTGRAIRFLRRFADRIYFPIGMKIRGVPPRLIRYLGYPVRDEVRRLNRDNARRRLGVPENGRWLVVLGGSQGATALNDWVMDNFESLGSDGIHIYCLTGLGKGSKGTIKTRSAQGIPSHAVFEPFSDDMGAVISSADLVVSRAGAGTIAELIRCQKPAILVPYPYAADDHQQANAEFLERQGGCLLVKQAGLNSLRDEVRDLIYNDWLLEQFRKNLERLDEMKSQKLIADDIEALINSHRREREAGKHNGSGASRRPGEEASPA